MKINKNVIIVLVLSLVLLISYINIFQNEFVWDDHNFILDNRKITSFDYIPYYFTHESQNSLWRPLRETLYIFTYQMWGLNPFGYHLNSLLLHTLITILIFFITNNIVRNKELSLFAALLFAVHPIHTARVTNMTASFDMLGLLFFLIGFYLFMKYRQTTQKKYYFFSIIVYIFSLLSSEEAITFIGILLLYDFCFNKVQLSKIKNLFKIYGPYVVITLIYLILHILIVKRVGRTLAYFEDSFYITFLNTIKAVIFYVKQLLFPFKLSVYHALPKATSVLSIPFLISFLVLLSLIFIMAYSYKRSKIIFFSFGWFFITMSLFYNLIPKSTLLADRYLYFPSVGFCLLLGYLIFKIRDIKLFKKNGRLILVVILVILLIFYSTLTIKRNAEWRNDESLLKKTIQVSPLSTSAHWSMGVYYRNNKDYDKAIFHLKKSIELSSKNYEAMEDLGVAYAELKDYENSIKYFKLAIDTYPKYMGGYYKAHNDLGLVYSYIGDLKSSVFYLKKAIEINPSLAKAHNDLGTVYAKLGYFDEGIEEISKAIEINPYEADYYYNLAVIYEFLEDEEKAEDLLVKALTLEPDNTKIKNKLYGLKS